MCKEQIFTIFGGTGDLTFRKLIPAFYNMEAFKNEDLCTQIVIIGRRDYTSGEYREMARRWVEKFARLGYKEEIYERLAGKMTYYRMDFTDESAYVDLDAFYRRMGDVEHIF